MSDKLYGEFSHAVDLLHTFQRDFLKAYQRDQPDKAAAAKKSLLRTLVFLNDLLSVPRPSTNGFLALQVYQSIKDHVNKLCVERGWPLLIDGSEQES